jgi:uncharacterized membrane protein YedE/YeeE
MLRIFSSLVVGVIFGIGLTVSEMINPARVIGFLDITGRWDPTLAFVMAGALAVTLPLFRFILRRPRPLLDHQFYLAAKSEIDRPLIIGAAIFGIGWGLAGFCPGPAFAGLASANPGVFLFVASMIAGQWLCAKMYV